MARRLELSHIRNYPPIVADSNQDVSNGIPSGTAMARACFSTNAEIMYLVPATTNVYKSINRGGSWTKLSGGPTYTASFRDTGVNKTQTGHSFCSQNGNIFISASINF